MKNLIRTRYSPVLRKSIRLTISLMLIFFIGWTGEIDNLDRSDRQTNQNSTLTRYYEDCESQLGPITASENPRHVLTLQEEAFRQAREQGDTQKLSELQVRKPAAPGTESYGQPIIRTSETQGHPGEPVPTGEPAPGFSPMDWVNDIHVRSAGNFDFRESHPAMATASDGTIYIAWENFGQSGANAYIQVYYSTDGGENWIAYGWFDNASYDLKEPSLAIGEGVQDVLLIAYIVDDPALPFPEVANSPLISTGFSWTIHPVPYWNWWEGYAKPNIWTDSYNWNTWYAYLTCEGVFDSPTGNYNVCFWRSLDYGPTWQDEQAILGDIEGDAWRDPDGTYGTTMSGLFVACFNETDNTLYARISHDFGSTWADTIAIYAMTDIPSNPVDPDIEASTSTDNLQLCCTKSFSGNDNVGQAYSTDGGYTWSYLYSLEGYTTDNEFAAELNANEGGTSWHVAYTTNTWWVYYSKRLQDLSDFWQLTPDQVNDIDWASAAYTKKGITSNWTTDEPGICWSDYRDGSPDYDIYFDHNTTIVQEADIYVYPDYLTIHEVLPYLRVNQGKSPDVTNDEYVPGRLVVRFADYVRVDDATGITSSHAIEALNDRYQVQSIKPFLTFRDENRQLKEQMGLLSVYILEFNKSSDISELVTQYQRLPEVIYAEPDYIAHTEAIPNDPLYSGQWNMNNIGQAIPYSGGPPVGVPGADIDAELAWDIHTGSSSVVVAVVDEGVDLSHPEFAGRLVPGYDFIDNDPDPSPVGNDAHGTACAGIVGAAGNNSTGVAGIGWGVNIMPVRVLGGGSGTWTQISNGIIWAADHGADVISMSIGGYSYSSTLENAVNYAYGLGALPIASAGNDNQDNTVTPHYPSDFTNSMSVGALSPCNQRKDPSTCDGETWWGSNWGGGLDVMAPGVRIPTTDISGAAGYSTGDYVDFFNGTSSACPHVSGTAGLILSVNPGLTNGEVRTIIQNSACDLETPGYDDITGYGRLNAHHALLLAGGYEGVFFIKNVGELTLTVNSITDNESWHATSGYPSPPFTISPGSTQEVLVNIDWTQLGTTPTAGSITIDSDDPDEPTMIVDINAIPNPNPTPAPENPYAFNGYHRAIPLAWEPPLGHPPFDQDEGWDGLLSFNSPDLKNSNSKRFAGDAATTANGPTDQTLQSYKVYRSATPGGPYTLIASGITRQYYRDETANNGVTYYYVIKAVYDVGESGYSTEVSGTPTVNGYKINAGYAASPPTINGTINPTEWASADVIDISAPGISPPVTLYAMNDNGFLYLAVDDPGNTTLEDYDQIGIYFDEDYNREWPPSSPSGEGNFWVEWLTGASITEYRGISGWWPANVVFDLAISPAPGVTEGISLSSGHTQYEAAIDLSASHLNAAAGDQIGFQIFSYIVPAGVMAGYWPQELTLAPWGDIWRVPAVFGDLKLSSPIPAPVANFSGSPTSGNAPLTVQFTDASTGTINSWNWSFPGGAPNSATGVGPHTVIYNNPGDFDVSLTVNGPGGMDTELKTNYIHVGSTPSIDVEIPTNLTAAPGVNIEVPINVLDNLTGLGVFSYQGEVTFDENVLNARSPYASSTGTISASWGPPTASSTAPNIISFGGFGTSELNGTGTVVNLLFTVDPTATPGSSTTIHFNSFIFNAGSPAANTSDGLFTVQNLFQISGIVKYAIPDIPLRQTDLDLTGGATQTQTTGTSGTYQFSSLTGGLNYTVTPSKAGDIGTFTIGMFDASMIARYVVGSLSLDANQQWAGDIDQNGSIQMYDAACVAVYVVSLPPLPNSLAGSWEFDPVSTSYTPLAGDMTNQNYKGCLMGDVDGNWPSAPNMLAKSEVNTEYPFLPDLQPVAGKEIRIPICIEQDADMYSAYLELEYPDELLSFKDIQLTEASSEFQLVANSQQQGLLKAGLYGIKPIQSGGAIAEICFKVEGTPGSSGEFYLSNFQVNNEPIQQGRVDFRIYSIDELMVTTYNLLQNYPNPFNPTTTIKYQLANTDQQHTTLRIYNSAGQLVRTLVDGNQENGEYAVIWNGLDNLGHETASGVYFYQLKSGDFMQTRKLLKMK